MQLYWEEGVIWGRFALYICICVNWSICICISICNCICNCIERKGWYEAVSLSKVRNWGVPSPAQARACEFFVLLHIFFLEFFSFLKFVCQWLIGISGWKPDSFDLMVWYMNCLLFLCSLFSSERAVPKRLCCICIYLKMYLYLIFNCISGLWCREVPKCLWEMPAVDTEALDWPPGRLSQRIQREWGWWWQEYWIDHQGNSQKEDWPRETLSKSKMRMTTIIDDEESGVKNENGDDM